MNHNRTDSAAHNTGSICKRETNKTIKYDKKCRLRRTVELSQKMSKPRLRRQKSGKWVFYFPKFRITCIIRNSYNQKTEAALLSFCQISGSFCGCVSVCIRLHLHRWTYYQYVQVFDFCLRWLFWCVTSHVI